MISPGGLAHLKPDRADLTALFRLALPVAVVQVGLVTMGAVDIAMVGRVSAADIAGVAMGNVYFFQAAVFGMGTLFVLDPVVAQAVGADDVEGAARGMQRGLLLAGLLTVVASLLLLPAEWVLGVLRQPHEVVPLGGAYARVSIPGVLPFYAFIVFRQSLQAMGRMKPILLTVLLANLANAGFNWVLVFGNLGFPAMGAVGSGWATTLSRWFMAVTLLWAAWPLLRPSLVPLRPEVLRIDPLLRLLRVGAPIGLQQQLEFGVFAAAGLLMGLLGTLALAAHQVALSLASLTFMVPVGVAQAAAVLVGQAVGRGDPAGARRAAGAGLVAGVGFMTATALCFLLFPEALAAIYTQQEEVLLTAALLIPVAGVFQVFDGLQVVAAGALRGVADTRVPMLLNLLGFWGIGLPVSAYLGFRTLLGPEGIWWGLAVGIAAVSLLLIQRLRTRLEGALTRVEVEEVAPGAAPAGGAQ